MITKIKIQITIVTDCDESCICLKKIVNANIWI